MSETDTICAISTAPGAGGIGIIRLSGRDAVEVASKLFRSRRRTRDLRAADSHTLHYGQIVDPQSGNVVDEALVSVMRAPATYTREDVVEINCHGGMAPLMCTLDLLTAAGVRRAEPGEFTLRAFLNGRIDLAQAEAVMDIINARTELSLRAANDQLQGGLSKAVSELRDGLIDILARVEADVDFPEEDIETSSRRSLADEVGAVIEGIESLLSGCIYGRILREGLAVAIVGRPNVGKSSLLNALLMQNRAIVTEIPGTTRDVIEEYLNIAGVPMRIVDTAGIRETHDMVEQEGVRRSLTAMNSADIVLVVLDASQEMHDADWRVLREIDRRQAIAVLNKADLPRKMEKIKRPDIQVMISCKTGEGLDNLRRAVGELLKQGAAAPREHAWAVNERHKTALEQAKASLEKVLESIHEEASPEFIAVDLSDALDSVGLIIGATFTEDVLERIFRDFCIGK